MANTDKPFGFKPVQQPDGANPPIHEYEWGGATAGFRGDIVTLATDGQVDVAGVTDTILGVLAQYVASGTAAGTKVLVYDDPDTLFEVQAANTSAGTPVTPVQAFVGDAFDFISTHAGSTTTGQSGMELDTDATPVTGQLQLVEFVNRVDNEIGEFAKMRIRFAKHKYATA